MTAPLVEVRELRKHFPAGSGRVVRAVDGVSFAIERGETLGLVGESGCGKTTIGRCLLRLIEPSSGEIEFDGIDLRRTDRRGMRALRRRLQIIFQDPYSSLNPRMTVGEIVAEPLVIHDGSWQGGGRLPEARGLSGRSSTADRNRRLERVAELLGIVGLSPDHAGRYPHQFSGGQRQRIGIARALALNPDFIVADEPVSALDVSVQAQIVNLLQDLQAEFGLTYLFISHGLAVVRHISTRVGVMYLGRLVELGPTESIYDRPCHPYTQALLASIPVPFPSPVRERAREGRVWLGGEVPTPIAPPAGCHFHPRCPHAMARCRVEAPELREVATAHHVACFLLEEPPI